MSLGKNIRQLRHDRGWTQADLSERTGIKINHLSRLEQEDSDPKLSTLYKLMKAFECTPDALLLTEELVTMDGALQQILARSMALPDEQKRCLINVAKNFCIAHGIAQAFAPFDVSSAGLLPVDDDG